MENLNTKQLISNFNSRPFNNEADVQFQFYAEIAQPILANMNKIGSIQYAINNEQKFLKGGRADAVFENIAFEIKKFAYFDNIKGIDEALYGRNEKDSGLYEYILELAQIDLLEDDETAQIQKITHQIGVGFDGKQFVFARFAITHNINQLTITKGSLSEQTGCLSLPLKFRYDVFDMESGIERLKILFRQRNKVSLSKEALTKIITPKQAVIRDNVNTIYRILLESFSSNNPSNRVITLYNEWDRVFGVLYGSETEQTDFVNYVEPLKRLYHIDETLFPQLDIKKYLFSLQTYFNIIIKLLVNNFLKQLINPEFEMQSALKKVVLKDLFEGKDEQQQNIVDNFFEIHFYEWFVYTDKFDMAVIQSTIEIINAFEMSSFLLKPETMQDILQEVYMGLIPEEMRHLMGEYFTPDWAVEFVLEHIGYTGDISKRICDPTCGSGAFLLQSIKKVAAANDMVTMDNINRITNNIVGFDINPISAIAAKANYILALFSNIKGNVHSIVQQPIHVPIYISDSVLTPVVYSEQNQTQLVVKTHLGDFVLPKFKCQKAAYRFLDILSEYVLNAEISGFSIAKKGFQAAISKLNFNETQDEELCLTLFEQLCELHFAGKNSFWGKIFKNSFAPIMINEKFDYVVGNPPWISWKSMSKTYRDGTLEVWQSYGIFEKNAYDKKTTHDDFGMAVTYVAIDYYLKAKGKLGFLLPASFIKSSKGGQGFRKFNIVRKNQNVPLAVYRIDDFSAIKLFTIPTMAFFVEKDSTMNYPMNDYHKWRYIDKAIQFDSHAKWSNVKTKLHSEPLTAFPVSKKDVQSSWLTIEDSYVELATKVLATETSQPIYKGRKGIEPAGAKGVYILQPPTAKPNSKNAIITNDITRQRRKDILNKGQHTGEVEPDLIYPMLGGRNIQRWRVVSHEYMLVPHSAEHKYGIPEEDLITNYPLTHKWLNFYRKELFDSRVQNGKFFDPKNNPFYRLDNVGEYTYSRYKVLWKEQTGSMSAVVVGNAVESLTGYNTDLLGSDKAIVTDSKILFLALDNECEAYFVCGILNAPSIRQVIDSYAISTNRGVEVLEHLSIPKYDETNQEHQLIAELSKNIHLHCKTSHSTGRNVDVVLMDLENKLNLVVIALF
ncbi:methyltransferase [Rodentibacter rarus]|uniref:Eco57I restriction-modification methylase domain-containing protein n=1 Tax=Rodentibacter rarus TaxID=1908260 RepID=UPI000984CC3F|nr:N-6 DNA methylase [Rodentibacter rarus]OOF38932.1 methyltransferase [Rodentibacter rarus]